ncbi:hypothetical protein Vadar_008356 [Vaccinium darrowii]|uniref:Uncharacterized protein n=1 Tax=Vaccinium darrowii TaxID=229202 RepID=A0ACB7XG76_9ERIC|nr:hypothetical protein Vadar_008356 [Vaccinium darrowii]
MISMKWGSNISIWAGSHIRLCYKDTIPLPNSAHPLPISNNTDHHFLPAQTGITPSPIVSTLSTLPSTPTPTPVSTPSYSLSLPSDVELVDAPVSESLSDKPPTRRHYQRHKSKTQSSHNPQLVTSKSKNPSLILQDDQTPHPPSLGKRKLGVFDMEPDKLRLLDNSKDATKAKRSKTGGVGRPLTFHQLKEFSRLYSPSLFFLSETKNGVTRLEVVKKALGMDGSLWVEPAGLAGGLAIFWKGATKVDLKYQCSWFIDVQINEEDGSNWRLINVYFSSRIEVRRAQWEVFLQHKNCLGEDWLIWGDMNDITSVEEKRGGVVPAQWELKGFQNFISQCNLIDLGFSGFPFTWCNNRVGAECIQERLDRVLATPSWRLKFSQACVDHLNSVGSDHFALLLHLQPTDHQKRVPFRFDARWVQEEEMAPIIEQAWKLSIPGSKCFKVQQRIKGCRTSIQVWKRRKKLNSRQKIEELQQKIHHIQNGPLYFDRDLLHRLKGQLYHEWENEELY